MGEVLKTINGYRIYIGGTWCEITRNGEHVFDGSIAEGTTPETVYKWIKEAGFKNGKNIIF